MDGPGGGAADQLSHPQLVTARAVPARVQWAVGLLDVRPEQRILEVGCGPGVAAGLIADQVTSGIVIGIDRSPTAISRATTRNAGHVSAGRARFVTTDLAAYEHTGPPFDTVLAMNVNLFWTGPATAEWQRVSELLPPGGLLDLFYGYGPDDPTASRDITAPLSAAMEQHGYELETERVPDGSSIRVTGVRAR